MNLLNLHSSHVPDQNKIPLYQSFLNIAFKSKYRFYLGFTLEVLGLILPTIIILLYVLSTYYVAIKCPKIKLLFTMGAFPFLLISVAFVPLFLDWVDFLILTGKRLRSVDVETVLANDPRTPIVYLRSFLDEVMTGSTFIGINEDPPLYEPGEPLIHDVVKEVGPMIAIGRPGEILPPVGSARLYLDPNSDWQNVVKNYLAQARFVIINPEYTPGILWETITAFQICGPEKIIVALHTYDSSPSKAHNAYNQFRAAILEEARESNIPINLPENIGYASCIYFDSDWTPMLSVEGLFAWEAVEQIFLNKGIALDHNKVKRRRRRRHSGEFALFFSKLILLLCATLFPLVVIFLLVSCES